MKKMKILLLSALIMNFVFVFACITVFTSTKRLGRFSVPPEEKTSLMKIVTSTSDSNKLRKFVLEAEESRETTSKALDTQMDVLKLVLIYAGFVTCFNTWCLFLVLRGRGESCATREMHLTEKPSGDLRPR